MAKATPPSPEEPTRKQFALSGPSAVLDPLTHAVRPDLADVRLAELVFAPHYASPVLRSVARAAPLRSARDAAAVTLATLMPGDAYELLDLVGDDGWGIAVAQGLVGYLEAAALRPA